MKIAICDADNAFTQKLKNIIYGYAEERRLDIIADCFSSGEDMLFVSEDHNIILLGFSLNGINGLETARILRERGYSQPIIFISDFTDFIFDAFKVEAFRFLLKKGIEKEIIPVLDDYFQTPRSGYPLWVKSGDETVCLNSGDIYYIEADNKHCHIHLKGETVDCNRTMARVYGVLPKSHFSKTGRAFVVNLNYISRYNSDFIKLKNGDILYPSRYYYKSFKEEYRRFINPYEV